MQGSFGRSMVEGASMGERFDESTAAVRYPDGHVLLRSLTRDLPVVSHGDGIYLFDRDGKRYVDAAAGALVASVGHGNREIADAVHAQLLRVGYVNGTQFTSEATEELATRLAALVDRELPAFGPARAKVIARVPSYHGNTLYALSASGRPHYRTLYGPLLSPVLTTPAPYPYRSGLQDYARDGADHYVAQLEALIA